MNRILAGDLFSSADFSRGNDLSISISEDKGAWAWYVEPPRFEPVRTDRFVGVVAEGGSVNFRNVWFNPHGHGTHTECVGHIAKEVFSVNQALKGKKFFSALLVSIDPEQAKESGKGWEKGDRLITLEQIQEKVKERRTEAIIIRTLPNSQGKLNVNYSNTNPAFLQEAAAEWISQEGFDHLLIDTPSVDREEDGGLLLSHHAFWNYPQKPFMHKTISELVFVPDEVKDGIYLMDLQVAAFENDAAPSRPILFDLVR